MTTKIDGVGKTIQKIPFTSQILPTNPPEKEAKN